VDESIRELANRMVMLGVPRDRVLDQAMALATGVVDHLRELDADVSEAVEHWRPERLGLIERNILRLALHELLTERAPPRVVIDEAVQLAHRFAGSKAPAFVNGVLDRLARRAGRL
jgi:N utilization substance protein B